VARGRCASGHAHQGSSPRWVSLVEAGYRYRGTTTACRVSKEDRPPPAASFTRTALLNTTFPQSSVPVRVADGSPCSWWHPAVAACTGSHHALHSTPTFGPAVSVSTIDRTVARNTERSLALGQEPRQAARVRNRKFLSLPQDEGPPGRSPCGTSPMGAENPALYLIALSGGRILSAASIAGGCRSQRFGPLLETE
jgi:hypothetical protein